MIIHQVKAKEEQFFISSEKYSLCLFATLLGDGKMSTKKYLCLL
jgi:hypothetical protein